jgi:predicted ArsR family transcriptional regulator
MADDLAPREAILAYLLEGPASTAEIADELGMEDRSVRRRLRRLAREGYVFSPERGWHRLTTLGRIAIAPP